VQTQFELYSHTLSAVYSGGCAPVLCWVYLSRLKDQRVEHYWNINSLAMGPCLCICAVLLKWSATWNRFQSIIVLWHNTALVSSLQHYAPANQPEDSTKSDKHVSELPGIFTSALIISIALVAAFLCMYMCKLTVLCEFSSGWLAITLLNCVSCVWQRFWFEQPPLDRRWSLLCEIVYYRVWHASELIERL